MTIHPAHKLIEGGSRGFDAMACAKDSPLAGVIEKARQFAAFDVPVLIRGEAGVGKAEMARAIHDVSSRAGHRFVAMNCVGMSDDLLITELLGEADTSAFGASSKPAGLLRQADGGTLYLGDISAIGPKVQAVLLRVATDGVYQPLGAHQTQRTDLRLISASGPDPRGAVEDGCLSHDLYYALSTTELNLPPLRHRLCDFPGLVGEKLAELSLRHRKPVSAVSDPALEFMCNYHWPGNLPELENELARMLIAATTEVLGPELISRRILQADPSANAPQSGGEAQVLSGEGTLKDRVERIEMRILRETLTRLMWNKSRAAAELGLSRVGLRAKLDRYGIRPPEPVTAKQGEG